MSNKRASLRVVQRPELQDPWDRYDNMNFDIRDSDADVEGLVAKVGA